jgi:hypothetical protein
MPQQKIALSVDATMSVSAPSTISRTCACMLP